MLENSRDEIVRERKQLIEQKVKVDDKLKIDIEKYQRMHTILLQQRGLYLQKIKFEELLSNLKFPHEDSEQEKILLNIEATNNCIKEHEDTIAIDTAFYKRLLSEEEDLKKIDGLVKCPTCKQDIHDIQQHKNELSKNKSTCEVALAKTKESLRKLVAERASLRDKKLEYDTVFTNKKQLESQIFQLRNLTFDEETLNNTTAVIKRYGELTAERTELELKIAKLSNRHDIVDNEVISLFTYDGENPHNELTVLASQLASDIESCRKHQQLSVDLRVKQSELKTVIARIKTSEEIGKKNKQRNKYVEALTKAYDTLHSSQFPRKLIMSYADIVSTFLQENLELFDIPYSARVADNFRIEMLDDQDRVLPAVSGGQEIMVGISLHLALHDLFSQSFPMMIIDEGTTHLDAPNRKAYFSIIKGLKEKSKLKQILIIDHDPQLSEVVDHVVNLNK